MRTIHVETNTEKIFIGKVGENEATEIIFHVSKWLSLFGEGTFSLLHQRCGDAEAYPCEIERVEDKIHWIIKNSDVSKQGFGMCELILTNEEAVVKSAIYTTVVTASLSGGTIPPEPWTGWVERVLGAGAKVDEFLHTLEGGITGQVWTKYGNSAHWDFAQGRAPYALRRLGSYLFEIAFNQMPEYDGAENGLLGGCSSYVQGEKLYRNFDWEYTDLASFHVICPGYNGMAFLPGLTDTNQPTELLNQLPYHLVDGVNDYGIMCATHVVYNDWNWEGAGDISLSTMIHLILTNVTGMETMEAQLADTLPNLHNSPVLAELGYTAQFIVTDGITTKAILPPQTQNGDYSVVDITNNPKMTNFRWVNSETVVRTDLQNRPTGVERWNMMPCTLNELRFTEAYEAPNRLSEFIGIDGTTKDSTDLELETIYEEAHDEYITRKRDGKTWQTMHSIVYSSGGIKHLWVQENWGKDYCASGGEGASNWSDLEGKPFSRIGDNLKVVNGAITVDTAQNVEQDNTKPITSAAVYVEVGNINALLALI